MSSSRCSAFNKCISKVRYIKCSFNLPDIIDRCIQGKNTGLYHEPGLPNITGEFSGNGWIITQNGLTTIGAITTGDSKSVHYGGSVGTGVDMFTFDASNSNPIYGNSDTVQPKSIELYFYIKY